MKRLMIVLVTIVLMGLTACGSSEPCEKCGGTPAKGYENTTTGEKEYYCADCTKECMWCQKRESTKHYTTQGEFIMFICDQCYEDLHPDMED